MSKFHFADQLRKPCRHCATFARSNMTDMIWRGATPRAKDPTATVTFIEFEGRFYAVTAGHVIQEFRTMAIQDGRHPEGYFAPAEPGVSIDPPFISMPQPMIGRVPDIAMRPIDARLPDYIGKKAFRLLPEPTPAFPLPYAMAAGFPTSEKVPRSHPTGERLAMMGVTAVAAGVSSVDSDQVQFFSEIEERLSVGSLSGMSGGPVFWSDGNDFGLLGFVKEAVDVEPKPGEEGLYSGPRVNFICQRASYETFGQWAEHTDREFPKQRDLLNEQVRKQTN